MKSNEQNTPTVFDDISRILASPMPRRRAMRLIGGLVVSGALASLWSEQAEAAKVCILPTCDKYGKNSRRCEDFAKVTICCCPPAYMCCGNSNRKDFVCCYCLTHRCVPGKAACAKR